MAELPRILPATPSVPLRPVRAPERSGREPRKRQEPPAKNHPESTGEEEGEEQGGRRENAVPLDEGDETPLRSGGSVNLRV